MDVRAPRPSTFNAAVPPHATVVIVGGGIAGCALAYNLAALGLRDVVVLEQNAVGSGTTWHAAGVVGRMRVSPSLARLNDRSAALYARIERESGRPTGWREVGGLTVARSKERLVQLRRAAAMARYFGVAVHEITAAEARERWPLANLEDVVGGVWLPNDGVVEPLALVQAVAEAARRLGVTIVEGARVTKLLQEAGQAAGVQTPNGTVLADAVVLCGGMWTRQLAELSGIAVPLQPVEHHYVLSHPAGSDLEGLPVVRDPDGSIYFRGRGDALMLGAFQRTSKPWGVDRISDDFAFRLLEPDWKHFAAPLEEGLRRLPLLQSLGIERFVNGPESFTPDGNPLVGEFPGVRRLYVCAGFNSSGLAYGGGVGEALAQWIVADEPPFDLWAIDVRRFRGEQARKHFLVARGVEVLGTHMHMAYPNVEFEEGRDLRRTPLHDRLASHGACFGQKLGLERPNWFARAGQPPVVEYSFERQNWFESSRAEHLATRTGVAIFDQSGFAKYRLHGRDALAVLQQACANDVDAAVGGVVYTAMLTSRGTFASDLTVMRIGEADFLMITGTAQAVADRAWVQRFVADSKAAKLEDVSDAYAVLAVMGPASRDLLQPLTGTDLSHHAFPFATAREMRLAGIRCRAVRLTYVGELGWEIYISPEHAVALYDAIWEAGGSLGLVDGGHYAINSLRLEKGYRAWGADISMNDTPLEAGLGFAVAWEKSMPFHGREALLEQRDGSPPTKRMVSLVLEDPEPVLWGGELVFHDEAPVGYTTSGAYGHTVGAAVALGWIEFSEAPVMEAVVARRRYEIEISGKRFPAQASLQPPYDPGRTRILQ